MLPVRQNACCPNVALDPMKISLLAQRGQVALRLCSIRSMSAASQRGCGGVCGAGVQVIPMELHMMVLTCVFNYDAHEMYTKILEASKARLRLAQHLDPCVMARTSIDDMDINIFFVHFVAGSCAYV